MKNKRKNNCDIDINMTKSQLWRHLSVAMVIWKWVIFQAIRCLRWWI